MKVNFDVQVDLTDFWDDYESAAVWLENVIRNEVKKHTLRALKKDPRWDTFIQAKVDDLFKN